MNPVFRIWKIFYLEGNEIASNGIVLALTTLFKA